MFHHKVELTIGGFYMIYFNKLFLLTILVLFTGFAMAADTMRCGTGLISVGETIPQVQHVCGKPADKKTWMVTVSHCSDQQNCSFRNVAVEERTYEASLGSNSYLLHFENGVLISIKSVYKQ